ncbi:MAG: phage integrase N-terminal SAM-like domain-containing protein [Pyrinomonadaceae bacterium]
MEHPVISRVPEQVREAVRTRHYSLRTEEAYLRRVRQYILFCGKRHPSELGAREVSAFISHPGREAQGGRLHSDAGALGPALPLPRSSGTPHRPDRRQRAQKPRRLPVVFTREEARAVLSHLRGEAWLMASLLYGSGLRLMGCVRLGVKDLDLERREITARDGKGGKERVTVPASPVEPLRRQLETARALHELDLREGFGHVYLPDALARKYPSADREWCRQYVFPARHRSLDPRGV